MSAWKQIALSLVVLALVAGGWYAWTKRATLLGVEVADSSQPARGGRGGGRGFATGPILVVAQPVATTPFSDSVRAIGTVAVARSIGIYPQVTATVSAVHFKAGDRVTAGETLVELDDADQVVEVDRARIALKDAQDALARAERLQQSNNITDVALSDARSGADRAAIDLRSAQIALSRRTIAAPYDGVVGLSDLAIGALVTPTTLITTLDDVSTMKVSFVVPERFAGRVTLGQSLQATGEGSAQPIDGRLSAIDSRIDPTARTLKLEATLDVEDAEAAGIKPGAAVTVALDFPQEQRLAVPSAAIQWDKGGSYVWKVDGDTVKRAAVTITRRESGQVLVEGEIAAGDPIAVEGVQRLREGAKIALAGAAPETTAAAGERG
ncbi:efflux RND transporter periplasmic adaptor subunit [Prosthecomicrobium pneumaticum]|uniref:RND family efflux transporter MFP subunit n=1 Tax=Prosthecomicrobium pneumaticum TaxID=81895 RepID=A0A7W9FJI6_9HYPH|nr:efflux RND transporter periplasmic adaptor subunit [Prosthecomicrobium pneumaticum]MBB5751752.1 RND family efflux transporter MFP subunit [Prosthecomicrobium pneumaticum]